MEFASSEILRFKFAVSQLNNDYKYKCHIYHNSTEKFESDTEWKFAYLTWDESQVTIINTDLSALILQVNRVDFGPHHYLMAYIAIDKGGVHKLTILESIVVCFIRFVERNGSRSVQRAVAATFYRVILYRPI